MAPTINLKEILNSPFNKPREEISSRDVTPYIDLSNADMKKGTMRVHIEIDHNRGGADALFVEADIDNPHDLKAFNEQYGKYMPRKKLWGIL